MSFTSLNHDCDIKLVERVDVEMGKSKEGGGRMGFKKAWVLRGGAEGHRTPEFGQGRGTFQLEQCALTG